MGDAAGDPRVARYGFAKLSGTTQGELFEYLIRKYEIVLGRDSKSAAVDVVLGSSMSISRKHAVIRYNFTEHCFEIEAMGKNGVFVCNEILLPGPKPVRHLASGDEIRAAECTFFFLLPRPPIATGACRNGLTAGPSLHAQTPALAAATHLHTPQAVTQHSGGAAVAPGVLDTGATAASSAMMRSPGGLDSAAADEAGGDAHATPGDMHDQQSLHPGALQ